MRNRNYPWFWYQQWLFEKTACCGCWGCFGVLFFLGFIAVTLGTAVAAMPIEQRNFLGYTPTPIFLLLIILMDVKRPPSASIPERISNVLLYALAGAAVQWAAVYMFLN